MQNRISTQRPNLVYKMPDCGHEHERVLQWQNACRTAVVSEQYMLNVRRLNVLNRRLLYRHGAAVQLNLHAELHLATCKRVLDKK